MASTVGGMKIEFDQQATCNVINSPGSSGTFQIDLTQKPKRLPKGEKNGSKSLKMPSVDGLRNLVL